MASVLAKLSHPLVFATILACGGEEPGSSDDGASGVGAFAGSTTGGTGQGGSSQGGSSGAGTTGGAGAGGSSAGGSDSGGSTSGGAGGESTGGGAGSGATPGGMGGAGAPAVSGDMYATNVMIAVHSEIRTMLNVTWTQAMAAENVFLEFTFEAGNVMTSRPKPGTTGMKSDVVIGVPASTPVTVRVVSRAGGVDYKTRDYMGTTGALPSGLPVGQVLMYEEAIASPDRFLFGAVENSTGGCDSSRCFYHTTFWLYIMDRKGRMVWYYADTTSDATSSFQRIAKDGEYIWIEKRPFSNNSNETRRVLKRTLDGTYSEEIPISGLADCIDVTDDGSLLYDANNELRERTRAGQTRSIWSCREQYPMPFVCYTNTINWNPLGNTVLMSYPEEDTVVEIDRETGNQIGHYGRSTGGPANATYTFAAMPAPPPPETTWQFGFQHFANISKDGTLMVSTHLDGSQPTEEPVAGQHAFEEFTIDRTNRTLTNRWVYNEGQEWPMYKGMVIKLPNDNYLANYGTGGVIREITPDKRTAFMVKFDAPPGSSGNDFFNKMVGHNELVDDLYALNGGGPMP